MPEELRDLLNAVRVHLAKIDGELDLGEERLKNKVDELVMVNAIQVAKDTLTAKIEAVDKRIDSLYLKVTALSGGIVGAVELILRSI